MKINKEATQVFELENHNKQSGITPNDLEGVSVNELHTILKKKVDAINEEMGQFSGKINDFSLICDNELDSLLKNIETIQNTMSQIC